MKKLFVLSAAVIALFVYTGSAFAVDVAPDLQALAGFGLHKTYETNNEVKLRIGDKPLYDGVTQYNLKDISLAGRVKDGYNGILPRGIISTTNENGIYTPYALYPNDNSKRRLVDYKPNGAGLIDTFKGKKVFWNVFTSPEVTVGTLTVPETISTSSKDIDDIVPYVELVPNSQHTKIQYAKVYFVRSGDKDYKPVPASDVSFVGVKVSGDPAIKGEFTDFDKKNLAIQHAAEINLEFNSDKKIIVEYDKSDSTYRWIFSPLGRTYEGINWGKLSADNMPLKVDVNKSVDVAIVFPGYFASEDVKNVALYTANSKVAVVENKSYDINFDAWSNDQISYGHHSLSFDIKGLQLGRTTLVIYIPNDQPYYREIVVTSDDEVVLSGDMPSIKPKLTYVSKADYVEGKPYYPSAKFDRINFEFVGNPSLGNGYFGLSGDKSTIYPINYYSYRDDNTLRVSVNLPNDVLSKECNIWWEFGEDEQYNLVSASISALVSVDLVKDTKDQLNEAVPYFTMKRNDNLQVTSMEWSFKKNSSDVLVDAKIPENVEVLIDRTKYTTSTIPISYTPSQIVFTYTSGDINYRWEFNSIDTADSYFKTWNVASSSITIDYSLNISLHLNASLDVSTKENSNIIKSLDLVVWDENEILSVDKISMDASNVYFILKGKKEGRATLSLVFSSEGNYYSRQLDVNVNNNTTIKGIEIDSFSTVSAAVIVNDVSYYSTSDDKKLLSLRLTFNSLSSDLTTTWTLSGDTVSKCISPDEQTYSKNTDGTYEHGYKFFNLSSDSKLLYKISGDIEGGIDIPNVLSTREQLEQYYPYVKLNREGTNVSTIEYMLSTDKQVDNYYAYVNISRDNSSSNNQSYSIRSTNGVIHVNVPEKYIKSVQLSFVKDEITYTWMYSPVNNHTKDNTTTYLLSWDISGDNSPIHYYDNLPIIVQAGTSADIKLTAPSDIKDYKLSVTHTNILSASITASQDNLLTVRLEGKKAGITSIVIISGNISTWPLEVWVHEGKSVPHLTSNIDTLLDRLVSGDSFDKQIASGDWAKSSGSSGGSTPAFATRSPQTIYNAALKPRFVMPTDPSPDAYEEMQVFASIFSLGDIQLFEDNENIQVIGDRDVADVFNRFRQSEEIVAVVLPTINIRQEGWYMFRVPIDNAKEREIYWHSYYGYGYSTTDESLAFTQLRQAFLLDDGTLTNTATEDYVNVAVYLYGGRYEPVITAKATEEETALLTTELTITKTSQLSDGRVGVAYSDRLTANHAGTTWTGSLPSGLTLSSNGSISGTPTLSGDYSFTATASDGKDTASKVFSIRITTGTSSSDPTPGGGETSGDVPGGETSGDQPGGGETSGDIPGGETSGDQPSSGGETSGDVPGGETSGDQPGGGETSGDIPGGETSGDQPGGGGGDDETPGAEPRAVLPEAPRVSIQSVRSTVIAVLRSLSEALATLIGDNTEVLPLEGNATIGAEREALEADELEALPEGETPAAIMPLIRVQRAAIYMFSVNLTHLPRRTPIFWHPMPSDAPLTVTFFVADNEETPVNEEEGAYVFLDDAGEVTTVVPDNQHVTVAAYLVPDKVYAPVITTKATSGGDDGNGGNEDPGNNGGSEVSDGSVGSSSGGCSAGFSVMTLMLIGLFISRRKG